MLSTCFFSYEVLLYWQIFADAPNETRIIVKNCHKEEKIASQRSPLDNKILAQLQTKATKRKSDDSVDNLMLKYYSSWSIHWAES